MYFTCVAFKSPRMVGLVYCAFLAVLSFSSQARGQDAVQVDGARSALALLLKDHDLSADTVPIDWKRLNDFYRRREARPAWIESEAARNTALSTLEDAPQQ